MQNPLLVGIIILGVAIILLVIWIIMLERRLGKLVGGKNGASLEDTIAKNGEQIEDLRLFRKTFEAELARHDRRIKRKMNSAKTLRFNPFSGTGSGGNQSFATALLDEDGSGVVLSTLYARDKVSIFAKPIEHHKSEFELTDEEKSVLE